MSSPRELSLRPVEGLGRWTGWSLRQAILGLVSMREVPAPTRGRLTETASYFRRDRHRHPRVDPGSFSLSVSGLSSPRSFTLDDLGALPQEERVFVMECAGNGNHLMGSAGLMGQARWSGPSLATVIEACGGPGESSHFVFRGLDRVPLIRRGYHYGLSLEELRQSGALLALSMNGEPLSRPRGFPVRLVVPGIYSMSHVKWLTRIEGLRERHGGWYNRRLFVNQERGPDGIWRTAEARWIGLKSVINRCDATEEGWRLSGWAWGGKDPIAEVRVSVDGGATWKPATTIGPADDFADDTGLGADALSGAWTRFSYAWDAARGPHLVASRAVDSAGNLQDLEQPDTVKGHYNQTRVKWRRVVVPG